MQRNENDIVHKATDSTTSGHVTRLRAWITSASRSQFGRNAAWYTVLTAGERVIAVAHTVLISRALGITEYGVYGLLIGTIGYAGSVAGFQMSLTATVFVARYRSIDRDKAAAVITMVSRFAWIASLVVVVGCLPFATTLSETLVGSSEYRTAVLLGAVFVSATILSGVQDGIAQGFEMFGALARLKIVAAVLVLICLLPVARAFGLTGVLTLTLAGVAVKAVLLRRELRRMQEGAGIVGPGAGISFRTIVGDFALPSLLVSLLVGFVTWLGLFLLSKQPNGFDAVAIASAGLQWRGPVLLLTAALGGVAMPAFSRLSGAGDHAGARRLRLRLSLVNFLLGTGAALTLVAGSGVILSLYGPGFEVGRAAFCFVVLSTVPAVVANVYMQELVGAARMWRQFWMQVPSLAVLATGFVWLVPRYQADGYGVTLLLGALALLGPVAALDLVGSRRVGTAGVGA